MFMNKLTPLQWLLSAIIGAAIIATSYYRHQTSYKIPAFAYSQEPRSRTHVVGGTAAVLKWRMSDGADPENVFAVMNAFADKVEFEFKVVRLGTQDNHVYLIQMWRGDTIIVGGSDFGGPGRFDLGLIQHDQEPDKVTLAKSLFEELGRAIGEIQGVVLVSAK
jgi:hypothetical protein